MTGEGRGFSCEFMDRFGRGNSEQAAARSHCQSQQRGNSDQDQARKHVRDARNSMWLGNEKDGGNPPGCRRPGILKSAPFLVLKSGGRRRNRSARFQRLRLALTESLCAAESRGEVWIGSCRQTIFGCAGFRSLRHGVAAGSSHSKDFFNNPSRIRKLFVLNVWRVNSRGVD